MGKLHDEDAIVTLSKLPFDIDDPEFKKSLFLDEVRSLEQNDVYSWYTATLKQSPELPGAKINLIHPATETHIRKHRTQQYHVISETPEMYKKVVLPYINTMLGDRLTWVDNILHHGAEADRVVFRSDDPEAGFVLLPDMKWDRKTKSTLYLMAILVHPDLKSVRDLNRSHIPLLKTIRQEILNSTESTFGVPADQLKLYFHYQPSYYRMHIHVASVALDQADFGRSILIDNVIDQLQYLGDDGYSSITLTYILGENHQLWQDFCDRGYTGQKHE